MFFCGFLDLNCPAIGLRKSWPAWRTLWIEWPFIELLHLNFVPFSKPFHNFSKCLLIKTFYIKISEDWVYRVPSRECIWQKLSPSFMAHFITEFRNWTTMLAEQNRTTNFFSNQQLLSVERIIHSTSIWTFLYEQLSVSHVQSASLLRIPQRKTAPVQGSSTSPLTVILRSKHPPIKRLFPIEYDHTHTHTHDIQMAWTVKRRMLGCSSNYKDCICLIFARTTCGRRRR